MSKYREMVLTYIRENPGCCRREIMRDLAEQIEGSGKSFFDRLTSAVARTVKALEADKLIEVEERNGLYLYSARGETV